VSPHDGPAATEPVEPVEPAEPPDTAAALVRAHLDELGVEAELMACDPELADTARFCEAYGIPPEDSANTILVVGKSDPPRFAACVVLATTRLDVNRVVRDKLGTRKASFAPPDVTREITGHEIGGVTVFGLPDGMPILVDARVMDRERIVLGGGSRSWKVIGPPAILERLPNVEVVPDLAKMPEPVA
jgi:prolyl-tRNA editing enzyme YbaK/EbsC (Cys-tRNA(Pro) deacylase)